MAEALRSFLIRAESEPSGEQTAESSLVTMQPFHIISVRKKKDELRNFLT